MVLLRRAVVAFSRIGVRFGSDYASEAIQKLQSEHAAVQPERSLYNENAVRRELMQYKGGKVYLNKDEATGCAELVVDHAEAKNAMTGEMMVQMADLVSELEHWRNGRLLTLRGANNTFCAGGHLPFIVETATPSQGANMSVYMQIIMSRLHRLPYITCAFIDGHALGGGAELATVTDLRVMTERAKIGFVQSTLGLSCGWGGATHLAKVIHRRHMLQLLASGRILSAPEAKEIGLTDFIGDEAAYKDWSRKLVFPAGDTDDGKSVRGAKRTVLIAEECDYSEALNRERDVFVGLWGSPQHRRLLSDLLRKMKS